MSSNPSQKGTFGSACQTSADCASNACSPPPPNSPSASGVCLGYGSKPIPVCSMFTSYQIPRGSTTGACYKMQ